LKFKLDENLGSRCAQLFVEAGHDCSTVLSQGPSGSGDSALIIHCRAEGRTLVTLDLDFANPLLFKPSATHGIAVLVREALHPRMN
jgi:predicted nuclease of predicted toxin-antitoxin system